MSGISSVGSYSSYVSYGNFASGKKIQSASDGAAELSIIQKQEAQIKGTNAATDNIGYAQDLLNISDGAMSGISDYLQRIRELAVQASNGLYSADDRAAMQQEVEQLKQGISDIASNTTYNTTKLLDGSGSQLHVAANADGSGMTLNLSNSTLEALGIADFDLTGDFDISVIDNALDMVSSGRSSVGAQSNALEYAYNYNTNLALNLTASQSRLEDLDYPKAISEMKKQEALQQYQIFMQQRKMQDEATTMRRLFAM